MKQSLALAVRGDLFGNSFISVLCVMKIVTAILVTFCTYSYAASEGKVIAYCKEKLLKGYLFISVFCVMKIVTATLVTFYTYSYAASEETFVDESDVKEKASSLCIFGVKSVSINLYTRDIPYGKDIGLDASCDIFDPAKPIVVLVHGFATPVNYSIAYSLTKKLIQKDFTVFSLDWSKAACNTLPNFVRLLAYPCAVKNTRDVAKIMAKYVISLIDECGVSLNNMIFIGHSLGAHISGLASKNIQKLGYGKVKRIIGADPAKPLFRFNQCKDRLCNTDAHTTVVLHTTSTFGMRKPIGHIDLYFNGGIGCRQPGCFILDILCHHFNAMLYLAIVAECSCKFPGVSMPYPKVTYRIPPYPQKDITDCFAMDCMIFDNRKLDKLKGTYYMFVNSSIFCTKENFSCQDQR